MRLLLRGVAVLAATLSVGTAAAAAPAERAPAPAEVGPQTQWAHDLVWWLYQEEFIPEDYNRLWKCRSVTRFEFAVTFRQLLDDAGWRCAGRPGVPQLGRAWLSDLHRFQRLTEEFGPELAALGVDVVQLREDLFLCSQRAAALSSAALATPLPERLSVRPLWQEAPERFTFRPLRERGCLMGRQPPARKPSRPGSAPLWLLDAPADGPSLARGGTP